MNYLVLVVLQSVLFSNLLVNVGSFKFMKKQMHGQSEHVKRSGGEEGEGEVEEAGAKAATGIEKLERRCRSGCGSGGIGSNQEQEGAAAAKRSMSDLDPAESVQVKQSVAKEEEPAEKDATGLEAEAARWSDNELQAPKMPALAPNEARDEPLLNVNAADDLLMLDEE